MSHSSSKNFCDACGTMLSSYIKDTSLKFICGGCSKEYDSMDVDTLRYEEINGSNIFINESTIKKIADDDTNPEYELKCVKCGHNRAKYIEMLESCIVINSCTKCKFVWIDNTLVDNDDETVDIAKYM